ncbi:MAG: hypothetical protein HY329_26445 [Chloroflexi bacterium]|nr:hypothetical protein [Chloroflexota bacterium]
MQKKVTLVTSTGGHQVRVYESPNEIVELAGSGTHGFVKLSNLDHSTVYLNAASIFAIELAFAPADD